MQHYHLLAFINLSLIGFAFISGIWRLNTLDSAAKIFCVLVGMTLLSETTAYYCAVRFHQNIWVLKAFCVIEIVTLSLYFNYSVALFRKWNIGIYIAVASFVVGIADYILISSTGHLSGYFMYYTGIVILSMALFSLLQLVRGYPYLVITASPHFWFAATQIYFWCFTILNWVFYDFYIKAAPGFAIWAGYGLCAVNYLYYLFTAVIFIRYPKMHQANV